MSIQQIAWFISYVIYNIMVIVPLAEPDIHYMDKEEAIFVGFGLGVWLLFLLK